MTIRTRTTTESTGLAVLTELEDSLSRPGTSPESVLGTLTGDLGWWNACQDAIIRRPEWLLDGHGANMREWINDQTPAPGRDAVPEADTAFFVARTLSRAATADEDDVEDLAALVLRWRRSGLLLTRTPPGSGLVSPSSLAQVGQDTRRRIECVLTALRAPRDELQPDETARTMVALAAMLLSGLQPANRPVVRVSVVFGDSDESPGSGSPHGTSGVLELREYPAGPEGLFPDPRSMSGTHAGPAFTESLTHAWEVTPWPNQGRCVLWRLVLSDSARACPAIDGGSLGAAFAIGLRELFRRRHTAQRLGVAWLRKTFHGLRPRTAITGVLTGTEELGRVTAMGDKLRTTRRRGWLLVAPEANKHNDTETNSKEVRFAKTLTEADRYARQWRVGRLLVTLTVVLACSATGVVIYVSDSVTNGRIQLAGKLADVSGSLLDTDTDLAQLFAVKAYQKNPGPQTRAALFKAVTSNPRLTRTFQADGDISATSSSANGRIVLTGTRRGLVQRWLPQEATRDQSPQPILHLIGAITDVASSGDGAVVAAAADTGAVASWPGSPAISFPIAEGQRPQAVAVSPSGRYVAVSVWDVGFGSSTLYLMDRTSGRTEQHKLDGFSIPPDSIVFPDDDEVVLFDGSYGIWERRVLPTFQRTEGTTLGFGVHDYGSAMSADGRYFSYTNGAATLPVWAAEGTPSIDEPPRTAQVRDGMPVALALSHDGSQVAYATRSAIYVAQPADRSTAPPPPLVLGGLASITNGTVAFLGPGGKRLLAASAGTLAIWDLDQVSRIATLVDATIPISCNACSGPTIGAQPSGTGVAVVDGNSVVVDVQRFGVPRATDQSRTAGLLSSPTFAPPVWTADGNGIILVDSVDGSAEVVTPGRGLPVSRRWPVVRNPLGLSDSVSLVRLTPDGKTALVVHGSGAIEVRAVETGEVLRHLDGPREMAPTASGSTGLPQGWVTADQRADHVAVVDSADDATGTSTIAVVYVTDVTSGAVHTIDGPEVAGIAYTNDQLLVQRRSGALETWSLDGATLTGTLQGPAATIVGPVTDGSKLVAEINEASGTDTVQLLDYPSGSLLGSVTPPQGSKPTSVGLAFSPDGNHLITATEDDGNDKATMDTGYLVSWLMAPDAWMRTACESAGHDLTAAQWLQYTATQPPEDLSCLEPS